MNKKTIIIFYIIAAIIIVAIIIYYRKNIKAMANDSIENIKAAVFGNLAYTSTYLKNVDGLFKSCIINESWKKEANRCYDIIEKNKAVYQNIASSVNNKMPYWFVGLLHMMESNFNFNKHLHNGDPLTARTVQIPKGRPIKEPSNGRAYTFTESAIDVLTMKGKEFNKWDDWSVAGMLYKLEAYNGAGYAARRKPSPYLWSGTNVYVAGKFVADGVYSSTAISKQIGVVPVIKKYI